MKNFLMALLIIFLSVSTLGCALFLVGAGAAGGVAISKDTATVNVDKSFEQAWNVTYKQLESIGAINLQDKKAGKIEANIQNSEVTANIKRLTRKTVTIEIKARKNLLPNVSLAQDILNAIIQQIE